ncbi:MAG TPA: ion channel [Desulfomicrobiaceae bacterium]|nr:ion channel [Desulfomicrobiaceae bacterium]
MPLSPRLRIRLGLALLAALLLFSVFGFMHAEHLSFVDALYFSVVTVTTVGYGDIHPSSPVGKILATVLILSGVFTFTIVLTSMTERLLNVRAKQERLQRLNMAIGSFFSEVGTELLSSLSGMNTRLETVQDRLAHCGKWKERDFITARKELASLSFEAEFTREDLVRLRTHLHEKTPFLLRILENPNMAEHEQFTELMWATFHLKEELLSREQLQDLPDTDIRHLAGDIRRVYKLLLSQWLDYMHHLQKDYPYLFSLAVRTTPFDAAASAIVRS